MFLTKVLIYGLVGGLFFTASTFSTIGISKSLNKTPVPDYSSTMEEEEEEEIISEYIPVKREKTHTEQLISNLTNFGNLEASLNVDINYQNNHFSVTGDVFVSMETLSTVELAIDVDINAFGKTIDLEAIYKPGTLYLKVDEQKFKMDLVDMMEASKLLDELNLGFDLSSLFANIDTTTLLNNLGSMESEEKENEIVYTCYLFDNIPPVIFRSDYNHSMTGLSISNIIFGDLSISLDASTNILGKGQNRVVAPNDKQDYINARTYFPTLRKYTDGIKYFTDLSEENLNALVNQIKSFTDVNNLSLGLDYDITVKRNNNLTFTTSGDVDFKKNNNDISVLLQGDLVNKEGEDILDSNFLVGYLDNTIYFNYNDELKLSYEESSIYGLIDIITTRLPLNDDLSGTLAGILPDVSTLSSPLFTLIKNGDYTSLLNYFNNISIDGNYLNFNFDASILGDTTGELILSIDASNNGLKEIKITNVYAFGYRLDISLSLRNYQDINFNKNGYTTLKYVNNILDSVLDLIDNKHYALNLSGTLSTPNKSLSFNGSTQFDIGEDNDHGVGKIDITDNSNKKHNVVIDVTRNKVSNTSSDIEKLDALRSSNVLFTYNNNLKGSFNLASLADTFSYVQEIALSGNKRVEKYKDLLTADFSHSVINEILNGNIEAILYQNLLNSVTQDGNNYVISINGTFLKENTSLDVTNLLLTIKCDNSHRLSGISFSGKLLDYTLDLSLDLDEYDSSYKGLTRDDSYFDFSDMGVLVKYLLNTANKDNFTLSGNIHIDILGNLNLQGYVHIEEDEDGNEKVYAKAIISNIPHVGLISEKVLSWDNRTLTIYFTDDEVYLDVDCKKSGLFSYDISKHIRLKLNDFFKDAGYYLLNYGFGIKDTVVDGSTLFESDRDIDLSKLLKTYSFDNEVPSWNLTLNMKELTGTNLISDLDVTIDGESGLMKGITASLDIISILSVNFDAEVTSYKYIGDTMFNQIKSYVTEHSNDAYRTSYNG